MENTTKTSSRRINSDFQKTSRRLTILYSYINWVCGKLSEYVSILFEVQAQTWGLGKLWGILKKKCSSGSFWVQPDQWCAQSAALHTKEHGALPCVHVARLCSCLHSIGSLRCIYLYGMQKGQTTDILMAGMAWPLSQGNHLYSPLSEICYLQRFPESHSFAWDSELNL